MPQVLWHCAYFNMVWISRPALFYRALLYNIGETQLLPSLTAMVIEAFGAFNHLLKHLQCLFGLFYSIWGAFIIFA